MNLPLDRATLGALYRSHGAMVLRRARSILRDESAAEDVLQEVFSSLVSRPEQFDGRSAPSTMLYAMATHLCLQRLRDAANRDRLRKLHLVRDESVEADASSRLLQREVLAALPEEQAAACLYAFADGMTWDEVAEVMGCSRRHVANLISRARASVVRDETPVTLAAAGSTKGGA